MSCRPYISITDFTNREQVVWMLEVLRSNRKQYWNRRLGVGVMMSWKTLHGKESKWTNVFPKKEAIADIFVKDEDAFNVLHYADYDNYPVLENLAAATKWGGPRMNGLQLDMIWPNPFEVRDFRQKYPEVEIILQVNTKALDAVDNDPKRLTERLKIYGESIGYALLDKSMGRGLGMDAKALLPFARAIVQELPHIAVAAAGGLGPDTLHLADPFFESFWSEAVVNLGGVSLDAQSKLRPSGDASDPIDWEMARLYLERAAERFDELIFDNR